MSYTKANYSIVEGTLNLCITTAQLDFKNIGDKGVEQICSLNTLDIKILHLSKNNDTSIRTVSVQLALLHSAKQSGTTYQNYTWGTIKLAILDVSISRKFSSTA